MAGQTQEASLTPVVSFSAGLLAACAPVQQASAHDPKGDQQRQIRHKKLQLTPYTFPIF